jgi:hypothetical protein
MITNFQGKILQEELKNTKELNVPKDSTSLKKELPEVQSVPLELSEPC